MSEQFFLDGLQAVSAPPSGTSTSTRAPLARRVELTTAPLRRTPNMSLYGFAVFGAGRLIDPTIVELADVRGGAVGAGLRSGVDMAGRYQGVTLGLEVARQFSNLPNLTQAWRTNINIGMRF